MAPKFPKCLKIAREIGDRRVDKVLEAIFVREEKAYKDDQSVYSQMVEEVESRIDHRHGLIVELKKLSGHYGVEELLAYLKIAKQEDFAEVGRLIRMRHAAVLKAGEKSSILKELKKLK